MLRRIAPFMAVAALAAIVPVVLAATPARVLPTQRIDVKVLLVSADGTEPGFGAWKAQLQREGVPYTTFVAYNGQNRVATITDEGLANYGANHAYYNAVILATGDLGHNVANADGTTSYLSALSDTEWASLAKFERTFGIRQLSDYTAPSPGHGLNVAPGATQDGNVGTLTPLGKAAFPYLKGPVPIANDDPAVAETFGYASTPVSGQDWQTLLAGPNGTAYLGIYTHPDDGREEMVVTVASNENQSQAQLEAMGQGRPVVATGVGGVPDVVRGCGAVCEPGDDHALAMAVVLLLRNPELASRLGHRGHRRLKRIYTESACIDGYRDLLEAVAEPVPGPPARIGLAA